MAWPQAHIYDASHGTSGARIVPHHLTKPTTDFMQPGGLKALK